MIYFSLTSHLYKALNTDDYLRSSNEHHKWLKKHNTPSSFRPSSVAIFIQSSAQCIIIRTFFRHLMMLSYTGYIVRRRPPASKTRIYFYFVLQYVQFRSISITPQGMTHVRQRFTTFYYKRTSCFADKRTRKPEY